MCCIENICISTYLYKQKYQFFLIKVIIRMYLSLYASRLIESLIIEAK